jgi:alkanesulfonate monooxygenase SsuD/methylene tetrahydromethanopterin reductase-like flavin-dependent oxidoreductase (luciferase family)
MLTAYAAWDLQSFSGGRFLLGLGTQVKGHNERERECLRAIVAELKTIPSGGAA